MRESIKGESMSRRVKENKESVFGWLKIRRYSVEKTLYVIQRISGIAIVGYLLWHVFFTEEAYTLAPPIQILFGALITFHALNGVRLVFAELGVTVGKPGRAVFPYTLTTLSGIQRLSVYILISAFLILIAVWILIVQGILGW